MNDRPADGRLNELTPRLERERTASFERYFPNWVVKMNEWYKQMCCCHLCNELEHMHRSIRLVRLRLLRLEPEPPSTPSDEEEAAGAPSADDEEGTVGGSDGAPEEAEPDYSESYQPVPMREIQSEHFGL